MKHFKSRTLAFSALLLLFLALNGCGGGGGSDPAPSQELPAVAVTSTSSGLVTSHTANVEATGGRILLPTGEQLTIPRGALSQATTIKISRQGSTYKLEPAGLLFSAPVEFSFPSPAAAIGLQSKAFSVHSYGDASATVETRSGRLRADKLASGLAGELRADRPIKVTLRHFSLIRFSIQDLLYLIPQIPAKYLQPADVLFALSSENYLNPDRVGFDWFPGHTALLVDPTGKATCTVAGLTSSECDIVESVPDVVRVSRLAQEFVDVEHHIYMGARRPVSPAPTVDQRNQIALWAQGQSGKPWDFLNYFDDSGAYERFSCVGLVEAAYREKAGSGIVNDLWRWVGGDGLLRPLDMFDKTTPVRAFSVQAGASVSLVVNPVFLDQKAVRYFDLRDPSQASSDFQLTATELPPGATFDTRTGRFTWVAPSVASDTTYLAKFRVANSYSSETVPKFTSVVTESLDITVRAQDFNLTTAPWTVSGSDVGGTSWNGSTLTFLSQTPRGSGFDLTGYFYWVGSRGQYGRENFVGTLAADGSLRLTGTALVPPTFSIATATYTALLAPNRRNIVNGSWSGNVIPSNSWSAVQQGGS